MNEVTRFEEKFNKTDGCWEWAASMGSAGYGHFWFRGRPRPSSQVSYTLYVGEIPMGMLVLHKCDNRKCVNPDHLFVGTNAENMADMVSKGRQAKGEALSTSKLTNEQAIAIRSDQRSQRKIGLDYGVSHTVIGQIKSGARWSHV